MSTALLIALSVSHRFPASLAYSACCIELLDKFFNYVKAQGYSDIVEQLIQSDHWCWKDCQFRGGRGHAPLKKFEISCLHFQEQFTCINVKHILRKNKAIDRYANYLSLAERKMQIF